MAISQTETEAATDNGRYQDKVDHPDPAAAPLSTDSEASGKKAPAEKPPTAAKIHADEDRTASHHPRKRQAGGWMTATLLLVALGLAAALLLGAVT